MIRFELADLLQTLIIYPLAYEVKIFNTASQKKANNYTSWYYLFLKQKICYSLTGTKKNRDGVKFNPASAVK